MFELAPKPRTDPRTLGHAPRRFKIDRAFISGMGHHHPERRVTNFDLMQYMDTTDEWIVDHTGIRERRYADAEVDTSDLGVIATRRALKSARLDPSDLDVLVCATSTPDALIPSTASYIANKMELRATAFDVNAACSGFIYGLAVAQGLLGTPGHDRVALCAAEKYSRVIDPTDRANSIFWGDSAGTVILQPDRPVLGIEIVDISLANRNDGADLVRIPIGGHFEMHGRTVKGIATEGLLTTATGILERNELRASDLRGFVCHQANLRMIEALAEELGLTEDQHWHNVEQFGNQGAAGVITAFYAGIEERLDELEDGDLFLLSVYGSGFTGGSALLRWVDARE